MYLTQLDEHTVTAKHLFWLAKLCRGSYCGSEPKHYIKEASEGLVQLWDVGGQKGVLVTQILSHPAGREFFVLGVAGDRILVYLREIESALRTIAKQLDCRWLGASAVNKRLGLFGPKLGWKSHSVKYLTEV